VKPDLISALAAVAALIVNIAFLWLLVKQLRLLQRQLSDASESFALEQLRIKRQATLEHLATTMEHRKAVSSEDRSTPDGTRLVHSHCHRRATGARKDPALLYA
jgi:hypothetical protein